MTSIHTQRNRKHGDGSVLLWVLLAATTAAVVVVRRRAYRRDASKIGHRKISDHNDEEISELTSPLPEDQDIEETAVDFVPAMFPFPESQKIDEDHSKDDTADTLSSFQSETLEL